ncbi:ANTAR domain-containing protein [Streptomyces sp. 7R007]
MTEQHEPLGELAALRREVEQLRRALGSHAAIDQAIGALRVLYGLGPEDGWNVLQHVSQHTNTKLRRVAEQVLRWVDHGELPAETSLALHRALVDTRRARLTLGVDSCDHGRTWPSAPPSAPPSARVTTAGAVTCGSAASRNGGGDAHGQGG